MQNCSLYLNFAEIYDTCSGFGTVERIQIKPYNKTNSFYVRFTEAKAARMAFKTMNNMKIVNDYITCTLFDFNNVMDQDNDYVPEVDLSTTITEKKDHDHLRPEYILITAEEGHNQIKVFDYVNTLINKPKVTPETFIKFGRNTYLVKVQARQGYMLQGAFKNHNNGVLSIKPYDDYNGSKGKIFNTDLVKLTEEQILNKCPPNVVDCFIIKKYDHTTKSQINTPAIILKFSNQIPPDLIEIGPFRMRVKPFTCSPKTCTSCLKYGHLKNHCTSTIKLCINCGEEHQYLSEEKGFCTKPPKCSFCQVENSHKTFSSNCPEFKKQKEICNIAYNQKTSFSEAKKIFNQKNGISFANIVKRNNQTSKNNLTAQSSQQTLTTPSANPIFLTTSASMSTTTSLSVSTSKSMPTASPSTLNQSNPSTKSDEKKSKPGFLELPTKSSLSSQKHSKSKNSAKNKNLVKSKSSSLTDLDNLDDDLISTEFEQPKISKTAKLNNDSTIITENKFAVISMDLDESPIINSSEDQKKDRKRKSSENPEELPQTSVKKKIILPGSDKHKLDKNIKQKPADQKPSASTSKTINKPKSLVSMKPS